MTKKNNKNSQSKTSNKNYPKKEKCCSHADPNKYCFSEPNGLDIDQIKFCQICSNYTEDGSKISICLLCGLNVCTFLKHAEKHYKHNNEHCLIYSLDTGVIWCYACLVVVKLDGFSSIQLDNSTISNSEQNGDSHSYPAGLDNLGNTCFMNSIMQCLSNMDILISSLNDIQNENTLSIKLLLDISKWNSSKKKYNPQNFFDLISKKYKNYQTYDQQDAHEFFLNYLNYIKDNESDTIKEIFSEHFNGKLEIEIKCSSCNYVNNIKECFNDIPLSIPYMCEKVDVKHKKNSKNNVDDLIKSMGSLNIDSEKLTVKLLLNSFLSQEVISSSKCDKCSNGCLNKTTSIKQWPSLLIFHIKNSMGFQQTRRATVHKKHVEFENIMKINLKNEKTYKLKSIVEHIGGLNSGHYVSYKYNSTTDQWFYISDHMVQPISFDKLSGKNVYMLFYEQQVVN